MAHAVLGACITMVWLEMAFRLARALIECCVLIASGGCKALLSGGGGGTGCEEGHAAGQGEEGQRLLGSHGKGEPVCLPPVQGGEDGGGHICFWGYLSCINV